MTLFQKARKLLGKLLPQAAKDCLWAIWYKRLASGPRFIEHINSVTLEVSSICNLKCEVCIIPTLPRKGMMKLEDFKAILSKLPASVKLIRMNYSGEPLTNKDIFKMIRHSKETRPDIQIHLCTNGTLLDKFDPAEIIGSGLDTMAIAIDGGSKASHEAYRVGSSFEAICENTRRLCDFKKQRGAKLPVIIMQSLLNALNAGEMSETEKLAARLGIDKLYFRYMMVPGTGKKLREVNRRFFDNRADMKKKYLDGLPDEYALFEKDGKGEFRIKNELHKCYSFLSPLIYFNGDVSVCCHDGWGECVFGNLLKEEFRAVMLKLPAAGVYNKSLALCSDCDISGIGNNVKEVVFNKDLRDE